MPSRKTITEFRDTLERLWLLDPVPAWQLGVPRLNQLGSAPKHHLADPALAATLLGANATNLLRASGPGDAEPGLRNLHHGPLLGALFESLVTLSVRTLADTLGLEVSHLRTHRGQREIDLVIHSADGRAIACEVKLSPDVDDHDVRHLHWLRNEMGDLLIDRIVVTTGTYAYRRPDGVAVIPLALLGP
jgi:predicted AAA+ superfamily ATPase